MENQVIKQADGKYSLYSDAANSFVASDVTEEELINIARVEAANRAESITREYIDRSDSNTLIRMDVTLEEAKDIFNKRSLIER